MAEKRWKCSVCGYIHVGEAPPETCPVCGVDSSFFELQPEEGAGDAKPAPAAPTSKTTQQGDIAHGIKPALFKISYGLFVISSVNGNKINAQCANTVFQISSEPPTVAIGINKSNYTHEFITASGLATISILGQQGHDMARGFGYRSGRDADKFAGVPYRKGVTGAPILENCVGYLEGKVAQSMDCGTHTLFLLDIVNGDLNADVEPMTYAYFRATK